MFGLESGRLARTRLSTTIGFVATMFPKHKTRHGSPRPTTNTIVSRVLNVSIVLAAVALAMLVWRGISEPSSAPEPGTGSMTPIDTGTLLDIDGIDWTASPHTLLLFVSTECGACTAALPTYKRIIEQGRHEGRIRTIALFKEPVESGSAYLRLHDVSVDDVIHVRGDQFRVLATPALALVTSAGYVADFWPEYLNENREGMVLSSLAEASRGALQEREGLPVFGAITVAEALQAIESGRPVVDIRDRTEFARGHIRGAINIPHDEVLVRAFNELRKSEKLIVYGSNETDQRVYFALYNARWSGLRGGTFVFGGLEAWREAGYASTSAFDDAR